MNEIYVQILLAIVTGVVVPVLIALGKLIVAKINNATLNRVVAAVHEAVGVAVDSVYQTYVSDIKAASADGKLSQDEAAEALNKAVAQAQQLLPTDVYNYINQNQTDVKNYLIAQIEAKIGGSKNAE